MTRSMLCLGLLASSLVAQAQVTAIVGAKVHTMGRAGTYESATVIISDGKVRSVGVNVPVPAGATVIDARGKVVTPGFFDAFGRLGVIEVELEDSTTDAATTHPRYGAAFQVADAINPRSPKLAITRIEGVTRALVAPDAAAGADGFGHAIAGQAATIHLGDGDSVLIAGSAALFVQMGEGGKALAGGARGSLLLSLREAFEDARDYAANRSSYAQGARREYLLNRLDLEALQPALRGTLPVLVGVHRASDIRTALGLAREFGLRLIIVGGSEAWMVAPDLARAGVPVIIDVMQNLPGGFESLGATLENAARLHAAGVRIAFSTSDVANPRNIKQLAGNAVAHGLPYATALEALTVNPARIFGMIGYGTLEPGMDADVVIWDGDPLEVTTFADAVWVRGEAVPMVSRQTRLRDRYFDLADPLPPAYRK